MIIITLERSEAVLEGTPYILDQDVPSSVTIEYPDADYVELTYGYLRVGPNGDFTDIGIAEGLWWKAGDPVPFSDVIITIR
jgi:hypothetical protein